MTRCKELVETLHKSGASISYADTLLVYDYWAVMGVKASATCPPEIADRKPVILIVDSDFKVDTVSGKATWAHGTDVMSMQPENYKKKNKPNEKPPAKIAKRGISAQLKRACHDLTQVRQYWCPPGSEIEPPDRSRIELPLNARLCSPLALWYMHWVGQIIPKQDHHLTKSWSQYTVVPSPVAAHYPLRVNPTTIWRTMSRLSNQCWLTTTSLEVQRLRDVNWKLVMLSNIM